MTTNPILSPDEASTEAGTSRSNLDTAKEAVEDPDQDDGPAEDDAESNLTRKLLTGVQ